ncbi:signal peptidase I [Pontimonas sp.]|nr:signal peptidase I [Pontimonas sp.]
MLGRFLRDAVIIVVAALVVSFLIKTFLIRSFFIPTESMEATLIRDDRIIVSQLTPEVFELNRGDIIVFVDPGGWLSQQSGVSEDDPLSRILNGISVFVGLSSPNNEQHLVKRVIGLPGDRVVCCDDLGAMSVNGVALTETYVQLPQGVSKVSSNDFDVTVPDDALWVMGDNRYNSADSRRNMDKPGGGFVPLENVVGRAIVISWPQERWTWLGNYPPVFSEIVSRLP